MDITRICFERNGGCIIILIDFNQVVIANFVAGGKWKGKKLSQISDQEARYMIFASILKAKKQFGNKYGEVVICCDDKTSWRKDFFEFYKANRKKNRKEDGIDWAAIFSHLEIIRPELMDNLPYKVVSVPKCEADDIIAVLCQKYSRNEKMLIYSSDKDFAQLQQYPNVEQYNPRSKQFFKVDNPKAFTKEQIILGQTKDGIPNIKSADNIFLDPDNRQKSIMRDRLRTWISEPPSEWCDETMLRGYNRNQTLIDFNHIPSEYISSIVENYDTAYKATRKELMEYFREKRLRNLVSDLQDF